MSNTLSSSRHSHLSIACPHCTSICSKRSLLQIDDLLYCICHAHVRTVLPSSFKIPDVDELLAMSSGYSLCDVRICPRSDFDTEIQSRSAKQSGESSSPSSLSPDAVKLDKFVWRVALQVSRLSSHDRIMKYLRDSNLLSVSDLINLRDDDAPA